MDPPAERVAVPTHLALREPGARPIEPLSAADRVEVTLMLRPRPHAAAAPDEADQNHAAGVPRHPSRQEFAQAHGADPADVARVEQFARDHGLTVTEADPALRSVKLAGPAPAIGRALGVSLHRYQGAGGAYRSADGPAQLPAGLAPIVQAVVGLDDRPYAHPRGA